MKRLWLAVLAVLLTGGAAWGDRWPGTGGADPSEAGGWIGSAAYSFRNADVTAPEAVGVVTSASAMTEVADSDSNWTVVALNVAMQWTSADGVDFRGVVEFDLNGDLDAVNPAPESVVWSIGTSTDCVTYTQLQGSAVTVVYDDDAHRESASIQALVGFGGTGGDPLQFEDCIGLLGDDQAVGGVVIDSARIKFTAIEVISNEPLNDSFTAAGPTTYARTDDIPGGRNMGEMLKGGLMDNCGAAGAVEIVLPAGATGDSFTALVCAAQNFDITPNAADSFAGVTNADGDTARGAAVGDVLSCFYINADWVCTTSGFTDIN